MNQKPQKKNVNQAPVVGDKSKASSPRSFKARYLKKVAKLIARLDNCARFIKLGLGEPADASAKKMVGSIATTVADANAYAKAVQVLPEDFALEGARRSKKHAVGARVDLRAKFAANYDGLLEKAEVVNLEAGYVPGWRICMHGHHAQLSSDGRAAVAK